MCVWCVCGVCGVCVCGLCCVCACIFGSVFRYFGVGVVCVRVFLGQFSVIFGSDRDLGRSVAVRA